MFTFYIFSNHPRLIIFNIFPTPSAYSNLPPPPPPAYLVLESN